jgi:hypothetical protein
MRYPSLTPIARIPYDGDPLILLGSNATAITKACTIGPRG